MTTKTKARYDNRTPADRARLDAAVRRVLAEATRWLAVRDLAAALGLDAGERHDGLMVSKSAGRLVALGLARRRGERAATEYACLGTVAAFARRPLYQGVGAHDGEGDVLVPRRARVVASTHTYNGQVHEPGTWTVTHQSGVVVSVPTRDLILLVGETS